VRNLLWVETGVDAFLIDENPREEILSRAEWEDPTAITVIANPWKDGKKIRYDFLCGMAQVLSYPV
jgi:hypothetical protein